MATCWDQMLVWLTAIEFPLFSGLFWLFWRGRRESAAELDAARETLETRASQLREGLHGFKLEVARAYARAADLRELESRLTAHLLRIEAKLDATALKTEALHARDAGGRS